PGELLRRNLSSAHRVGSGPGRKRRTRLALLDAVGSREIAPRFRGARAARAGVRVEQRRDLQVPFARRKLVRVVALLATARERVRDVRQRVAAQLLAHQTRLGAGFETPELERLLGATRGFGFRPA